MMSLKDIKELNNKFKKNKEIAYKYDGTELRTLNGEHIGLDLMLSDEGLELQICKVNEINYTKNGKEKIWETFAFEEINIDKFETDYELDKYLEYIVDFYENRVKNDIDEEGFVINRDLAQSIDYMEYKGILVQYIYDTNTLIFSLANKETLNDSDDLDTIVYRNYTRRDIETKIDTLIKNLEMNNSVKIRKLMQDIEREVKIDNTYKILTRLVISMETKYNLQEEEIIKQLEMILKSIKKESE